MAQATLQNDSIRKLERLPEGYMKASEPRSAKKLDAEYRKLDR